MKTHHAMTNVKNIPNPRRESCDLLKDRPLNHFKGVPEQTCYTYIFMID